MCSECVVLGVLVECCVVWSVCVMICLLNIWLMLLGWCLLIYRLVLIFLILSRLIRFLVSVLGEVLVIFICFFVLLSEFWLIFCGDC